MLGRIPTLTEVIAFAAVSTSVTAANLVALCWFGMWMGMSSKSANLATLKTLVFVQIIPLFIIYIGSSMGLGLIMIPLMAKAGGTRSAAFGSWYPFLFTVVPVVLFLAKDIFFFVIARRKLYGNFRDLAVRAVVPIQFNVPQPAPRLTATPPVITARL